ncbi:MAG TPA: thioesterase [Brevundimonas sp.]|uniref:acyl-CoA thioesterase n=1 Tax=Brevundimonas naejangsanensis TaxID=588932 RepID=UPI000EE01D96|nr:thioesterase [Brevundimonas sp.]
MSFTTRSKVRFAHVDAAGIVFYPRYFEMLNGAVEDWFAEGLGVGFAELHLTRGLGVPTVSLDSRFAAPSRLGDELDITIEVKSVGRSSCAVAYTVACGDEVRMTAEGVLVCMILAEGRSTPWPDDVRDGLAKT